MDSVKRFRLGTVVAAAILVGFAGFSLGFNYPRIEDYLNSRFGKTEHNLPSDLSYGDVEQVYDLLKANYAGQLDANQLIEGAKKGLVAAAGDPYTIYLTAAEAKEFKQDLDGQFSGIGAEIAVKQNRLVVVAPLDNSPAQKAGLRAGDWITAIDGQDTTDMSAEEAVQKIRGTAGSEVKLTIVRGNDAPREVALKRAVVEVPALSYEIKNKTIGYIELSRFSEDVAAKLAQAAQELKAKGATSFVLDLRNNPGGLLSAAVDVSDEFLDVGRVIVEERKDSEVIRTFRSTVDGALVGAKVAVLINEGSASASEIVAGALMENQAGITIGTTTFGKGSVQELIEASGEAYLKVTVARWYTPQGKNISEDGIAPTTEVKLSDQDFNANRDPQLLKAIEYLQARL